MKKLLLALFVLLGPVALYAQVNLDTRIPAPQVKGLVEPENGGFGLSTLSLSGCPRLNAGVWTVNAANCTLSGGFPSTPGIANCSGTPCTSWNVGFTPSSPFPTNYIAPSGTNGQILATVDGTATWIPPSGSTSTGGSVAYVNLTNPGSYTVCPTTVTFTGGGSPSVSAAASIFCAVHGGVAVPMAVILGNAGYGYTSTPSVTITGGTGSGATAVAEMGSFVIALNTTPIPGGPANASLQNGILSIPYYPNAVTNIIPGTNVSCTPTVGGQCTGDVTISATGGGGGGSPGGNPNDIQVNGGSGTFGAEDAYQYDTTTHTVSQQFSYNTPGYNFGSPGIGPSSGGLTPSMWNSGFSSIYGQGNSTLMNFTGVLKTSNGDFNGINLNTAFFGANIDGSAEGYVPFRNLHQIGAAPFNGIVSSHTAVTGGNNLTFSSHGGGGNYGAGRPTIDLTDDVQAVTVTGVSGGGSSGTYTTATVSGTPFSVSVHGTLVNEIDVTPNVNNTPTSVTYTLSLASGCSVGQMLSFGPNLLESMLIQSTGTSGGHQTVTANARMSHAAGTEYWCGGWAGRYADLPANDISGIKELYYVLGTPANNQMAIARQTPGSTDGAFLGGGTYNIYHGGILVDPRDLSSGITGNAFAMVSDNDASWTVGSHAEVSNGMFVLYSFNNDVSTGNLNPYSIGNHFSIGCIDGDASCGDLNNIGSGSQTVFSLVNGNNPNLYTTGGGLWHRDEVFQLAGQGSWGTFAHFYTNPVAPMFEWGTTNNGFNVFQVDDHAAFMKWTGSNQTWTWDGLNFEFGSGPSAPTDGANYTWRGIHHFLPATTGGTGLDFTETTNPFTPTAGHDYLYSDATSHCLEYSANGGSFACLGSGGGGSGISGQAAGVIPLASTATTIGAQSHIDDGVTTAATVTISEPTIINDTSGAGSAFGLTWNTHAPSVGSATTAKFGVNAAGQGTLSNATLAYVPVATYSAEVVSFSATPTFSTAYAVSRVVLTGSITSFTLGAGADGQSKTLCFKQGSGPWTVTNPTNVHGFFAIGTVNAEWSCQTFAYDNTDSIWLATTTGVINQ